ncbi:hypothetical protein MN608_10126 [Microdochium nivale]|nr:hypothetical protein MN608_10126 [Microdochium nivale]
MEDKETSDLTVLSHYQNVAQNVPTPADDPSSAPDSATHEAIKANSRKRKTTIHPATSRTKLWLPTGVTATLPSFCTICPVSDSWPLEAVLQDDVDDNNTNIHETTTTTTNDTTGTTFLQECTVFAPPSSVILLGDGSTTEQLHCPAGTLIQPGRPLPSNPCYLTQASPAPLAHSVILHSQIVLPPVAGTALPGPMPLGTGGMILREDTLIPEPMLLLAGFLTVSGDGRPSDLPGSLVDHEHHDAYMATGAKTGTETELQQQQKHDGTIPLRATSLPAGVVLPADTLVPAGTTLPQGTVLAPNTVVPRGSMLPAGLALPWGSLVPGAIARMTGEPGMTDAV